MKHILVFAGLLCILLRSSAQTYLPVDAARNILRTTNNPEQRFRALRTMDRACYTTGLFDSSAAIEKEMFAIARELKRDSLMAIVYRGIGNRYVFKADYNFSLIAYSRALEYAETNTRRASLYGNLAYVYIVTENNAVALSYLEKMKSVEQKGEDLFFRNLYLLNLSHGTVVPDLANKAKPPPLLGWRLW